MSVSEWQMNIIDEFTVILHAMVNRGAIGGALPLFTEDEKVALERSDYVNTELIPRVKIQLTPGKIYKMDDDSGWYMNLKAKSLSH